MAQKIAYLDCHSGISGNMFLGAMLDAGLAFDTLQRALVTLPLAGFELRYEPFSDKGICGTYADVAMSEQEQPLRHLADIVAIINTAQFSPFVQKTSLAIFQCLAEAEATVHGSSIEEVHFHEVGAVDAIVDIVGAAIALEALGIEQLYASPLPLSGGHVQTAHGLLPVPAPATLEILRRVNAPWRPCTVEGEMVTPTGAAILATLARFEMPAIAIERVGYGFGRKRFPWPNCLRLCIGQTYDTLVTDASSDEADTDWVMIIEANIDNMSGELLGDLMERLLAAGALDVSYTPMHMKKNRPAVMIRVICSQETGDALAMLLLRETTTLGVRIQHMQRLKARRSFQHIETPFGPLLVKIKHLGKRVLSAAPEYEECQRIARERGIPLTEVYELAQHIIENDIIAIEL